MDVNNNNNGSENETKEQTQQSQSIAPDPELENLLQRLQTHFQAIDGQNAREINVLKLKESELLREIGSYSAVLENQYSMFCNELQTHATLRQKYLKKEMEFLQKYVRITDNLIPLIKHANNKRKKPLTEEQQTRMNFLSAQENNLVDAHQAQYRNQYIQFVAYLSMYWLTGETGRRRELVAQFFGQLRIQNYLLPNKQLRDELTAIRKNMTSIRSDYENMRRDDQMNEMLYIRAMNQRVLKRSESMANDWRSKWFELYKRRDSHITRMVKDIGLPDNWLVNADKKKWLQKILNESEL